LTEEELAAKWQVQKIVNSPDIPQAKPLIEGFRSATFDLKGSADFKLTTTKDSELFAMVAKMTENGKWRFNVKEQLIQIGTESEGYSIMGIFVSKVNNKILFELQESGIVMEMIIIEKHTLAREELKRTTRTTVKTELLPPVEVVHRDLDGEDIIPFEVVDEPPLAPDCKSKWSIEKKRKCTNDFILKHIQRKFNTDLAGNLGLSGRIRIEIEFVIDKNGDVINAKGSGGPELMNQNGAEVVSIMPKFQPGIKDGNPVNVSFRIPIIFQVQD
jgi:hypothetical protein